MLKFFVFVVKVRWSGLGLGVTCCFDEVQS